MRRRTFGYDETIVINQQNLQDLLLPINASYIDEVTKIKKLHELDREFRTKLIALSFEIHIDIMIYL